MQQMSRPKRAENLSIKWKILFPGDPRKYGLPCLKCQDRILLTLQVMMQQLVPSIESWKLQSIQWIERTVTYFSLLVYCPWTCIILIIFIPVRTHNLIRPNFETFQMVSHLFIQMLRNDKIFFSIILQSVSIYDILESKSRSKGVVKCKI